MVCVVHRWLDIFHGLCCLCGALRSLDSSHSITSQLSSVHSSQDSLHKVATTSSTKKKSGGLKSSLGRIFSKKEKGHKELATASGGGVGGVGGGGGSRVTAADTNELHVQPPDVISKNCAHLLLIHFLTRISLDGRLVTGACTAEWQWLIVCHALFCAIKMLWVIHLSHFKIFVRVVETLFIMDLCTDV